MLISCLAVLLAGPSPAAVVSRPAPAASAMPVLAQANLFLRAADLPALPASALLPATSPEDVRAKTASLLLDRLSSPAPEAASARRTVRNMGMDAHMALMSAAKTAAKGGSPAERDLSFIKSKLADLPALQGNVDESRALLERLFSGAAERAPAPAANASDPMELLSRTLEGSIDFKTFVARSLSAYAGAERPTANIMALQEERRRAFEAGAARFGSGPFLTKGVSAKSFLGIMMAGRIEAGNPNGFSGDSRVWLGPADEGISYAARTANSGQPGVLLLLRNEERLADGSVEPIVEQDVIGAVVSDGKRTVVLDAGALRAMRAAAKTWAGSMDSSYLKAVRDLEPKSGANVWRIEG